jgi:hypothetical protein
MKWRGGGGNFYQGFRVNEWCNVVVGKISSAFGVWRTDHRTGPRTEKKGRKGEKGTRAESKLRKCKSWKSKGGASHSNERLHSTPPLLLQTRGA